VTADLARIPDHALPLLYAALGDGLGAGVEGGFALERALTSDAAGIGRKYFPFSPFGFAPGEVTDDTQMGLAAVFGARESDGDDLLGFARALRKAYSAWYASRPPDVGGATSHSLSTPGLDGGWCAWGGGESAGNGSLMRSTAPFVLGFRGPALAAASAWDSAVTHPDPRCVASCVFVTAAIEALVSGTDYADAIRAGTDALGGFSLEVLAPMAIHAPDAWCAFASRWSETVIEVSSVARSAAGGEHVDCTRTPADAWPTGFVLSSLGQAVWAAGSAEDAATCLRHAVLHGGYDADSIASAAGGLIGARFGRAGLDDFDPSLWEGLRLAHAWEGGPPPGRVVDVLARLA
jgi:ADP-ribosyl-[dinitrogen reductase] hydrolase